MIDFSKLTKAIDQLENSASEFKNIADLTAELGKIGKTIIGEHQKIDEYLGKLDNSSNALNDLIETEKGQIREIKEKLNEHLVQTRANVQAEIHSEGLQIQLKIENDFTEKTNSIKAQLLSTNDNISSLLKQSELSNQLSTEIKALIKENSTTFIDRFNKLEKNNSTQKAMNWIITIFITINILLVILLFYKQ